MSMNGTGSAGSMLVHGALDAGSEPTTRRGPLRADEARAACAGVSQAADGDFKAGDAFVAGNRGRAAGAHRIEEGDQLGAQRLVMADREMAHRIAAVRLEAEAFGDLTGQQIAHHILAARRDRDAARLERRQPVGVDMREHAGGGAELEQRDILALGDWRWRAAAALRTISDSVNQRIRSMSCTARSITTPTFDIRGGNGPTRVIAIDRISSPASACLMAATAGLKRSTCPTISVTPARAAAATMSLPLLDRGGDRLFDQDVDAARRCRRARPRDADASALRWSRHRRLRASSSSRPAKARQPASSVARRRCAGSGIDDPDQRDVRQAGQDAGMVGAHDAGADDADAQRVFCVDLCARCPGIHMIDPNRILAE